MDIGGRMIRNLDTNFKRILFDNLVLRTREKGYLIMNLRSFRRTFITEEQYEILCQVEQRLENNQKINREEEQIYHYFLERRQFLSTEQIKSYDDNRFLWYKNKIDAAWPLVNSLTITPTFSCNFKCKYCYQREFPDKSSYMEKEDIDAICEYVKFINGTECCFDAIKSVSINGGESCQPRNVEVINYVLEKFSKNKECTFGLYTNGSQLTMLKEKVDFARFDVIQVSLDGYAELFPAINGVSEDNFQKVLDGIEFIVEKVKTVKLVCMLTPMIIENVNKFIDILDARGILKHENISLQFSIISNFSKETIDSEFMDLKQYLEFRKRFKKENTLYNVHLGTIREARSIAKLVFREMEKIDVGEHACSTLESRGMMFAPNGNVYFCMYTGPDKEEIGCYRSPKETDKQKYMENLYRSANKMPMCRECSLKYICRGGCPLFASAQGMSLSEGYCGLYKSEYFWESLEELF